MLHKPSPSQLLELPVHSLQPGMYVAQLDRPWLETPFALQGFFVRSDAEILELAEHCSLVYVDPRRRDAPSRNAPKAPTDSLALRAQFQQASVDYESASEAISKVFRQVEHGGRLNVKAVEQAIDPLVRSVVSHSEALAALARMKRKDDYLYNHALSTTVWSALIGQQLGLDPATLRALALGTAMQDLGKTRLPDAVLNKREQLNDDEWRTIHNHVAFSIELIDDRGAVAPEVLEVIGSHHERYDGSGYPAGLTGSKIPLLGQIAGLADSYDAMLTTRPYAHAHTSFSAVQELIDLQGTLFSKPLIEQFVQAVGLFPTGSLVELNSGEVAIVVAQNPVRRLRPKVMIVLDSQKQRVPKLLTIDLLKYERDTRGRDPLWIVKELPAGSFDLDVTEFFL